MERQPKIMAMHVLTLFKLIKLFVLDVDGVLTNGQILLLDDGQQARSMNIKDGYALQLAIKKGYEIVIISGGTSAAVQLRLQKLGITNIFLGVKNKQFLLSNYMAENNFTAAQMLYMGDDIPDVKPMQLAGLPCCPADAAQDVKTIAQYISPLGGGEGCVRDVIEKVLTLNDDWNDELDDVSSI